MQTFSATYSPEDNKLRLYCTTRLEKDLYTRVRASGFIWAPKQELFVAPAWTPERESLCLELAGEIGDEDKSLVQRSEERAERFDDYSTKRAADADRAHKAVKELSDGIPFGQPILIGHHSERHARKDADKIERGMRKAVKMWETSKYWEDRAASAIGHAKYKELPGVRHRRIKGLEADERKILKAQAERVAYLKIWENISKPESLLKAGEPVTLKERVLWLAGNGGGRSYTLWSRVDKDEITPEAAIQEAIRVLQPTESRWLAHIRHRLTYERAMLSAGGGLVAERQPLEIGGRVLVRGEWVTIVRINKKGGVPVSVTTNARYVSVRSIEEIKEYQAPDAETAAATKAAMTTAPLTNYPGPGFLHITAEQWKKRHKDYKGTRDFRAGENTDRHRVRFMLNYSTHLYEPVFITDEKRKDPPALGVKPRGAVVPAIAPPEAVSYARAVTPAAVEESKDFAAMKQSLKVGVQVVSAPQLFPTPPGLAARVVELAELFDGARVLEPSAGTGNLLRAVAEDGHPVTVQAVELCASLAASLKTGFPPYSVTQADFLEAEGLGSFDRVIMNPPFKNGSDIRHIHHALAMLKPGGRLVAICANGPRQREALQPLADHWEDLEPGSFASEGTNVNAALLVINK